MKTKNIIVKSLLGIALIVSVTSCDNGFDSINEDPNKVPDNKHAFYLTDIAQAIQYACDYNYSKNGGSQGGADIHQRVKALSLDVFTQYNMGSSAQASYSPNDEWQSKYWGAHFVSYLGVLNSAIEIAETYEDPNAIAIALVWRANMQALATDYYGPIPFPTEPTLGVKPPFIDLQKQYEIIFNNLDRATKLFDASKKTVDTEPLYKGDIEKWQKFCNTLRLRLALKMSEIDPALCSTQSKAALDPANGGVLGSISDDAMSAPYGTWGSSSYVYTYYYSWGGGPTLMTKTMEDVLTGIGGRPYSGTATGIHPANVDPRGAKMFDPSPTGSNFQGGVVSQNPEPGNYRDGISKMSVKRFSQNQTRKIRMMTYAEACFLLAEAVERNFVTSGDANGTAEQWYNKGVEASFSEWDLVADASSYLASTDKNNWGTSAKYGDAVSSPGNSNLEKIVTQRYIALFPDLSNQIWNDKRRLNLPAMHIPQYRNTGDGVWPTDGNIQNPANFIQRTAFPQSEPKLDRENYEAAVAMMGGDGDKSSTPLWWASKRSNYCTSAN